MTKTFTWIPLYQELATLLVDWENRQTELISCLENLRNAGVKVTPLNDQDKDGSSFLMKEIDPFTFFGTFNRQIRNSERLAILTSLKQLLGAESPLPEDFSGIPIVNNQRSWFVAYQYKRGRDDVSTLWHVFRLALQENPLDNPEFANAFDRALEVWGVSTNLTMGLFWIRPDVFLNLDQTNRSYLDIKLPSKGLNADFYIQTVRSVMSQGKSLTDISFDAWKSVSTKKKPEPDLPKENDYWLVGAYWDDRDPADQTPRFLAEGIWQNGYSDRYLDEVKDMKVGDRIGIKSASTQKNGLPFDGRGNTVSKMEIKAIGTIVSNRGDGQTVEVEWDPDFDPKNWYFFTFRGTVWRIQRDEAYQLKVYSEKLIDFVWGDKPQDYEWFCSRWWDSDSNSATPPVDDVEDDMVPKVPYGIEDVIASGVFLVEAELNQLLNRLHSKKNLILQGSPGVGKTFLAKKLAYALMGEKDERRVEMVQFHQSYSYEDFVRGYRPLAEQAGTFGLQDSVFYNFCKAAEADTRDYVFIIDEINRGNLSQIFGELLMLIEADKRGPEFAVPLVYQRTDESRFFVPKNVFVIGLMNLADRSLAIVDYALRRRFTFKTLSPQFGNSLFRNWLSDRKMSPELVDLVMQRMEALNRIISDDPLLGKYYNVGHSFFCPKGNDFSGLDRSWYEDVVETEIIPLLNEYWFDNPQRVQNASEGLLA